MSGTLYPPMLFYFGSGAPGASIPHSAAYYDTGTNPYTSYIYHSGAWHTTGASTGGVNATQLQGRNISATPPNNNDVLTWIAASSDWEPKAPSGTAAPLIVQHGLVTGNVTNAITLGSAPVKGNLLLCLFTHNSNNVVAATGWALYTETNGTINDGFGVMYKIAGASESATQTPLNSNPTGATAIWELSGAANGIIDVFAGQHDVQATPTLSQALTTTGAKELILGLFATSTNNTNLPTGVSGFTQDDTSNTTNRAAVSGHASAASAGAFTLSATWAANPTNAVCITVAIA